MTTLLQKELQQELQQELESRGFKFIKAFNDNTILEYALEGKLELYVNNYGWNCSRGYSLNIEETYRCNGTNENRSYYLCIEQHNENCGRNLERVKITQKDGAKRKQNLINTIVNKYIEMVA